MLTTLANGGSNLRYKVSAKPSAIMPYGVALARIYLSIFIGRDLSQPS
jgi:hypothetical protein